MTSPPGDWNRLAGDIPFLRHEFLAALEHTGSAMPKTGWQALHLTCSDAEGTLLGALPLYLKSTFLWRVRLRLGLGRRLPAQRPLPITRSSCPPRPSRRCAGPRLFIRLRLMPQPSAPR